MIVGAYSLDLYCRHSSVSTGASGFDRVHYGKHSQFVAQTRQGAMRQARGCGWVFSRGDVTCPACVKKKRPTPRADASDDKTNNGAPR